MATRVALERRLDADVLAAWHVGRKRGVVARRRCPSCCRPFLRFPLQLREQRFELDECERCRVAWFDRGELERLPVDVAVAPGERVAERPSELAPLHPIERVALQIGLPLLPDSEFVAARANVTVALAAASLLAPLLAAMFPEVREGLLEPSVAPWRELLDLPSLLLPPGLAAAVNGLLAALAVVAPWERLLLRPLGVGHWRWFVKLPVEAVLMIGERIVGFGQSLFDDLFDGPRDVPDGSDGVASESWRLTALFALPIAWASLLVLLALDDFGWPELAERLPAPWLHVGGTLVGLLFGLWFRARQARRMGA